MANIHWTGLVPSKLIKQALREMKLSVGRAVDKTVIRYNEGNLENVRYENMLEPERRRSWRMNRKNRRKKRKGLKEEILREKRAKRKKPKTNRFRSRRLSMHH